MRPLSFNSRLLLSATVALIGFLGASGAVVDAAFRDTALTAVSDRLQGHVYTILAAADLDLDDRLYVPEATPEPRLSRPQSGVYAHISGADFVWESESTLGVGLSWPDDELAPAESRFEGPVDLGSERVFLHRLGVAWELDDERELRFTFNAAETSEAYESEVRRFRRALWGGLAVASAVLLLVQGLVLRWSLRPLRVVSQELRRVETGERERIDGEYPRELRGLTGSINRFIGSERNALMRYRNSLADLAHSLKTPLSVIRTGVESEDIAQDEMLRQVERMDEIVAYQLKRGSTSGHLTYSKPQPVAECAEQIASALEKVHQEKQVSCSFDLSESLVFVGERGDLMEVLGNLLENAFKWCARTVELSGQSVGRKGCRLIVEDDGPGIAQDKLDDVLMRGVRGDERVQGHGIGLAMVREIVESYDGQIEVGASDLGGARIEVVFPGLSE